jgi:hypothetical protein
VAAAWSAAEPGGSMDIYMSTSVDEGETFSTPVRVRSFTSRTRLPVEGQANHPQIAVARDGTMLLAWDEVDNGSRRIIVARTDADEISAAPVFRRDRSIGDRPGVYPAIALTPTTSIVAWTSGAPAESTIEVLRARSVR